MPTRAATAITLSSGQSNTEGKRAINHLEQLLADPKTAEDYQHLRAGDGWAERPDVLIRYTNGGKIDKKGKLSVGYASPANRFAPELGFGHVVGAAHHKEYGPNQANLLRDLRVDLGAPDMPMIVGELGQSGPEDQIPQRYCAKHMSFRAQQASVAKMPEFKDTVRYVPTGPYTVKGGPQLGGGYHYRGGADTFLAIGNAFGKAMVPLLEDKPVDRSREIAAAGERAAKKHGFGQ